MKLYEQYLNNLIQLIKKPNKETKVIITHLQKIESVLKPKEKELESLIKKNFDGSYNFKIEQLKGTIDNLKRLKKGWKEKLKNVTIIKKEDFE
jgi:uncharacterized protein YfdQ (DUF2303 family)